jgi:hypothetical protein
MPAPASAYAALGLEPGADREAIERAYRDLIKRYHPDRSGGDAARAAEINRAYFELRREHQAGAFPAEPMPSPRPRRYRDGRQANRRRPSRVWPVLLIVAGIILVVERDWLGAAVPGWIVSLNNLQGEPLSQGPPSAVAIDSAALEGPLDESVIATSIEQAIIMVKRGDDEALADNSRDCHRRMRADPSLKQLDRCAAFEDAVAVLGDRDPLHDSTVFNASAITARQMTAASLLSSDYLAIERRLDRIRTAVQFTLRPAPLPPAKMPIEIEPETEAAPEEI